jgi:hypothetical protein
MERSKEQIAQGIVEFAEKNNLHIHPGQDPTKWADLVIVKGGCPCVPGRNSCPCAYALEDIKTLGRCRCGLFTNDGYLETYNNLTNHAKPKKEDPPDDPPPNNIPKLTSKARETFLMKVYNLGFLIEEKENNLILKPRGLTTPDEITITEVEENQWRVTNAAGAYHRYLRGQHREWFEAQINQVLFQANQEVL